MLQGCIVPMRRLRCDKDSVRGNVKVPKRTERTCERVEDDNWDVGFEECGG